MSQSLKEKIRSWKRPAPYSLPVPRPKTPYASFTFSPLTPEIKAQQEADRIKFNLPF